MPDDHSQTYMQTVQQCSHSHLEVNTIEFNSPLEKTSLSPSSHRLWRPSDRKEPKHTLDYILSPYTTQVHMTLSKISTRRAREVV